MTPNRANFVWILGAGFSQPLGGPILAHLLSPGSFRDLDARYGTDSRIISAAAKEVCHIYNYGRAFADGHLTTGVRRSGEKLWDDAEVFVDLLDSAAGAHSGALTTIDRVSKVLRKRVPSKSIRIEDLREAARHLIAAECSTFSFDVSLEQERWSAHVEWANQLDFRHTIITFNYDRALERISEHRGKHVKAHPGLRVLLPSEASEPDDHRASILKLHGSVDWQMTENRVVLAGQDFALSAPDDQLVIATPGPTKSKITEALEPLWRAAENAIEKADAIVFVGYRFPPTDATARRRILGAIERRAQKEGGLALHIVLGPNSRDSRRLFELLKFMVERGGKYVANGIEYEATIADNVCRIHVHELYSQDFLTVYKEASLLR